MEHNPRSGDLLLARPVLWYSVRPDRQVLLVIVRDPTARRLLLQTVGVLIEALARAA
jgi:hypothetical protein